MHNYLRLGLEKAILIDDREWKGCANFGVTCGKPIRSGNLTWQVETFQYPIVGNMWEIAGRRNRIAVE
jgi:hypothetical protein